MNTPIVDISGDVSRQTVIAAGTADLYQGHPTTVLTRTGKLICVWTTGHGGPCGPAAESHDGGRTWTRIDGRFPAVYAETHANCPTLQKMSLPDGRERLLVFSAKRSLRNPAIRFCPLGIAWSDDDGATWREAPPANLSSAMPPTGFMPLADGSVALFGQVRHNPMVATDRPADDQDVWMAISVDGLSWSVPRIVASSPEKNLCEPFAIRSPNGREIALLLRENRHAGCSMMCFSRDEGATWTAPVDTAPELTGDRHEGVVLPDGRYFIAFRDRMIGSTTYGQYVAWVGTWDDLRNARPGQCRVHLVKGWAGLLDADGNPCGGVVGDTGYSGVELLPSGELLCTTYVKYWPDARQQSVVCTRLNAYRAASGICVMRNLAQSPPIHLLSRTSRQTLSRLPASPSAWISSWCRSQPRGFSSEARKRRIMNNHSLCRGSHKCCQLYHAATKAASCRTANTLHRPFRNNRLREPRMAWPSATCISRGTCQATRSYSSSRS